MSRRGRHSQGRHRVTGDVGTRFKGASLFLVSVLVSLALVVVALPLARKGEWRTVQTGSMEPLVSPGDVVLVSPTQEPIRVGDAIAFQDPIDNERDVLHRVVAVEADGSLVTKGDANDADDPWRVDPATVIGSRALTIPKLGFFVQTVSSDLGIFFFLVVPALFLFINEARVWYRFIRYGSNAFLTPVRGRHLAGRQIVAPESAA